MLVSYSSDWNASETFTTEVPLNAWRKVKSCLSLKCDESNRQELRSLMPLASNVYSYIDAHDGTLAVGCLKSDHLEIRRTTFPDV